MTKRVCTAFCLCRKKTDCSVLTKLMSLLCFKTISFSLVDCHHFTLNLFVCLFNRSMACPYWWLCGVCTATHWDQKHSSLIVALTEETSMWGFYRGESAVKGGQGDRTELRTMLPFQPSGLNYFSQQRLYICLCVFTYIKKAYLFVGHLVVVWNFYLKC